ncbi:uncharacterized protein LOC143239996 isoform X1 [Tachypleus tridentatus]|uniref:uncharacterized protein LOC143239996 isoform X1 n=1 Tax=Tachypleus tridentatus TaxID=6853 RepID=UPI003FD1402E
MSSDRSLPSSSRATTSSDRGNDTQLAASTVQDREFEQKEQKINPKLSKALSTSAKSHRTSLSLYQQSRIQKELAEITLDPPPNCSLERKLLRVTVRIFLGSETDDPWCVSREFTDLQR